MKYCNTIAGGTRGRLIQRGSRRESALTSVSGEIRTTRNPKPEESPEPELRSIRSDASGLVQSGKAGVGFVQIALALLLLNPAFHALGGAGSLAAPRSDLTLLQCGNLIYGGNKSSVCFADRFLTEVAQQTCLRVNDKFCPVRLDTEALFDYPFCVLSGNESFSFTERERKQLHQYLLQGGFLMASPGCSDEKWDKSFRQELKIIFPEHTLQKIPMSHPVFSVVNRIPRLTDKNGKPVMLEGLEINGRLVMIYSTEGLNDVQHAKGCCCCGGNEIRDPARVNVNVFTYAVLY